MDWAWISLIVGVIVLLFIIVRYRTKKVKYEFDEALLSPDEREFKNLLNGYRQSVGLSYLRTDKKAGFVAYEHCIKMVNEQRVYHNKEDGRYDGLIGGSHFNEIVNGEFYNVLSCFRGFMESEDHFKVINGKEHNTVGLSVERDGDNKVYATVIFFRI
jgi:uncharacterized protein YkwD